MCASAAADEINYEFDLNVIAEKMAERYVKEHCSKAHILNKETKVAKKPMGSDKHPKSFKHHNIDGKDSSLTMIDPEPNVMDSSIHINTNNAGSHHEKNFDNNDDFFEGLDDFLDKSMAHNIEENRDYDPHSIAESKSSNNSISNGSSGNMHQDFNNLILESTQNIEPNVNKKRKVS
uniref:Uncharacterized protein n=1 Tax=Meloidogyne javanica TaxID=6303 RepID=A0A915MZ33_MELJA